MTEAVRGGLDDSSGGSHRDTETPRSEADEGGGSVCDESDPVQRAFKTGDEEGFVFVREFMLPHAEDAPAAGAESAGDEAVAGAVGGNLIAPKGGVGFRPGGVERAAVPEAAVDEESELEVREDVVGFPQP